MITNRDKYVRIVFLDEEDEPILDYFIQIVFDEGVCVVEYPIDGGTKQSYMSSWLISVNFVKEILLNNNVPSSKITVFGYWAGKSDTLLILEKETIDSGSLREDYINSFNFIYIFSLDEFKGNSQSFKVDYQTKSQSIKEKIISTTVEKGLQQELDNFKNLVQQVHNMTKTL